MLSGVTSNSIRYILPGGIPAPSIAFAHADPSFGRYLDRVDDVYPSIY